MRVTTVMLSLVILFFTRGALAELEKKEELKDLHNGVPDWIPNPDPNGTGKRQRAKEAPATPAHGLGFLFVDPELNRLLTRMVDRPEVTNNRALQTELFELRRWVAARGVMMEVSKELKEPIPPVFQRLIAQRLGLLVHEIQERPDVKSNRTLTTDLSEVVGRMNVLGMFPPGAIETGPDSKK